MANNSNTLVDEKVAISLFLDSLLTEPEINLEQPQLIPVVEVKPVEPIPIVESIPDVVINEPEFKIAEPPVELKEQIEEKVELKSEEEITDGIPAWANEPFQILLFNVAGLKLAVPLIDLCGVIKWNGEVTEMPGHADFYMGILQHLDYKIAVIDTARMVLPEHKIKELDLADPKDRVNHIVLIDNYRWGLACDNIGEVITLQPQDVRWRTSQSSRGWLAGTVIEHMCALLNSEGFAEMLKNGQTISEQ